MRALAEKLLTDLGDSGSIFMYTTYEKTVIEGLAKMFPDLADDLAGLIARLVDLHPVTRDHYYDPAMRGSWSLKAVLPTVAPDLDYSQLEEVQDGVAAGRAYLECIALDTDVVRRIELRMKLREYCKRDTLGMVRLVGLLTNGRG
jgi:predicted RecB family nuclease